MMKPKIIDWQVTNKCTRKCSFCYGPTKNEEPLSWSNIKCLIDKFIELGAEVVGVTGGEALLHESIADILHYLKSNNLRIGLNTNCDLYSLHRDLIIDVVDALELPLEASTKAIHDRLRGENSFSNVIEAIDDSYKNTNIIYRIGTVLVRDNFNELRKIENILRKYSDRIMYWKIYQYINYSNKKMKSCSVEMPSFNELKENFFSKLPENNMGTDKIIFDSHEMRNRSYFLVKPNGTAFIPILENNDCVELEIGNLIVNSTEEILTKWNQVIDKAHYTNCERCIFRKAGFV